MKNNYSGCVKTEFYSHSYFLNIEVCFFLISSEYERIFLLLEGVQGPLAVKKQFVEFTIKEAAR